jgi:hypothetical protein
VVQGNLEEAAGPRGEGCKLPDGTTAYTLRHSTITDLVLAGLPLLTVRRFPTHRQR